MQNVMPLRFRREAPAAVGMPAESEHREDSGADAAEKLESGATVAAVDGVTTIDAVGLGSLASIAVRCALVVTAIGAAGAALVWLLASSAGVVERVESFMRSIGFRGFEISAVHVVLGMTLLTAGIALTLASGVVIAGAAYNLLAARGRGLQVRLGGVVAVTPVAQRQPGARLTPAQLTPAAPGGPVLDRQVEMFPQPEPAA